MGLVCATDVFLLLAFLSAVMVYMAPAEGVCRWGSPCLAYDRLPIHRFLPLPLSLIGAIATGGTVALRLGFGGIGGQGSVSIIWLGTLTLFAFGLQIYGVSATRSICSSCLAFFALVGMAWLSALLESRWDVSSACQGGRNWTLRMAVLGLTSLSVVMLFRGQLSPRVGPLLRTNATAEYVLRSHYPARDPAAVEHYLFLDPVCPRSREVALQIVADRPDVANMTIIWVPTTQSGFAALDRATSLRSPASILEVLSNRKTSAAQAENRREALANLEIARLFELSGVPAALADGKDGMAEVEISVLRRR